MTTTAKKIEQNGIIEDWIDEDGRIMTVRLSATRMPWLTSEHTAYISTENIVFHRLRSDGPAQTFSLSKEEMRTLVDAYTSFQQTLATEQARVETEREAAIARAGALLGRYCPDSMSWELGQTNKDNPTWVYLYIQGRQVFNAHYADLVSQTITRLRSDRLISEADYEALLTETE